MQDQRVGWAVGKAQVMSPTLASINSIQRALAGFWMKAPSQVVAGQERISAQPCGEIVARYWYVPGPVATMRSLAT